jgi:hypothetical protein
MANVKTLNVETNGFRNVVIRATMVSDGSADTTTVYNATSSGSFGVSYMGQTIYPGIHTTLVGLHYDVQDTKIRLLWEATADADIMPLGSAPEDFDWRNIGGIKVPPGLTGATGSIKVQLVDPMVNATYFVLLFLRKNVP